MTGSYRAIQLQQFAESFREGSAIIDLTVTEPGEGEIRVRNLYCGVNGIFDTQSTRNKVEYVKLSLPTLTGVEAVGVVEAVGPGVTDFAVGNAAVTTRFRGGYRESNTAPAGEFVKVPEATADYLTLASAGVSALLALEHAGALRDGETVAISAAAGGLGHLLVQIAVARGCHVVAVCGGKEKSDFVRSLGAHRVIDYRSEDVGAVLAAEYPDSIDVAVDTVSGRIFDAFLANLARHGRLVVSGAASDMEGRPELITAPRIAHAIYYKGASVRGFMNGLLSDMWPAARDRVFTLYRQGKIKVTLDAERFERLEGIYDAIDRLLSGASMGKVIVALDPKAP